MYPKEMFMTVDFRFGNLSHPRFTRFWTISSKILSCSKTAVNIPYVDNVSHSKPFRTVEEALEYFYTLADDEEPIDICQLPPEECGCLTDEEDIDEDTFQSVLPANVCGKIEISINIDNDEISNENMSDHEEPSTTKVMPNLMRKLKSNKANVDLQCREKEYLLHLANMTGLYAMQKGEDFSADENDVR
ncbi:uncharacterized protein TNCV_2149971 [Trichonephila clavipes]|nr:uncharacterized protein TNCV_2149971 [Trichonephila clavipes]